jgi:hypothetical protein
MRDRPLPPQRFNIPSLGARRAVEAAWDCIGACADEMFPGIDRQTREALRHSDLAQRLAAGQDMFPDIYAQMPFSLRFIESFYRPKNVRQFTVHLIQYLDWYLKPDSGESLAQRAGSFLTLALWCSGVTIALGLLALLQFSFGGFGLGWLLVILALCWASWSVLRSYPVSAVNPYTAAEVYFYLVQAYAEAPEDPTGSRSPAPHIQRGNNP